MSHSPPRRDEISASHYQGTRGVRYYEYQHEIGKLGAVLNRSKFARYAAPGDTVVDLGCGGGELLASLDVAHRIGVEPGDDARRAAEERGIACVASSQELETEIADVAISNHALEHTLRPFDELQQLHRALKPGGTLALWLPIDDWRSQRAPRVEPDHHLYTWTPVLLANLLTEVGFDVVECRVMTRAWPPHAATLSRLPAALFSGLEFLWAVARRRRQLMAIARRV